MSGFNINSVTLSGTLTRDPELKEFTNSNLCKMRLAYNTTRKNSTTGDWEEQPNFIDLAAWGGLGTWYAKNLRRGTQVVVEGELRWNEWETDSGDKRQSYTVHVNSLVPTRDGTGNGNGNSRTTSSDTGNARDFEPVASTSSKDDEDIPF